MSAIGRRSIGRWWARLRLALTVRLLVGYARRAGPRPPMQTHVESLIRADLPYRKMSPVGYAARLWPDDPDPGTADDATTGSPAQGPQA